jgi:hypothetical protein
LLLREQGNHPGTALFLGRRPSEPERNTAGTVPTGAGFTSGNRFVVLMGKSRLLEQFRNYRDLKKIAGVVFLGRKPRKGLSLRSTPIAKQLLVPRKLYEKADLFGPVYDL